MAEMVRVRAKEEVEAVVALARETWQRHYTPLIGAEQVAYMLEKFQSELAVSDQLAGGYEYYLVIDGGVRAGYFALVPDAAGKRLMLSKIYILAERQGQGLGTEVVAFVERRCREQGLNTLWLTVNKHNSGSIAFYERAGFVRESAVVSDIGCGFVMDDYVMAKRVAGEKAAGCRL